MAGGDSPNMRAKKGTKADFDRLQTQVLGRLELSPRGLDQDQMLQILIVVGREHLDDLVAAAAHLLGRPAPPPAVS